MPRYIDADALKESLKELEAQGGHKYYRKGMQDCIDYFIPQVIDDEPTADVEPVRHGRWIRGKNKSAFPAKPSAIWYCSVCGERIHYNTTTRTYQIKKPPVNIVNARCRKCGAKMDGGEQECD